MSTQDALTAALASAQWISPHEPVPHPAGQRPAHELTGRFHWDGAATHPAEGAETGAEAVVYATAHGVYELFVNGVRVGDEELSPGFSSYRSRLQVQRWEITALLQAGENTVTVLLSDGWFRGRHGFVRRPDGFGTDTAFLAAVLLEPSAGAARPLLATGAHWESRPSHITRADLMDGQSVDLRLEGLERPGRPPAAVLSTDPLCADRTRLVPAEAPAVRRIQELRPTQISTPGEGVTVVDFGQNINGWVRLHELGPAGTRTVLRHGEAVDEAGLLLVENIQAFDFATRAVLPAGQVDEVISAGRAGDVFEPRHTTHGFRYVQIEGAAGPIGMGDIVAVVVHSELARTGTFTASDPLLNTLHDVVDWSFRGNACAVPTDCPQRERSGFTGDWQVFADTAALLYDVAAFSESWSTDLAADQWADGRVPTVVPNPAGNGPSGSAFEDMAAGSAGWGDAAVLVPWSMWRAYGDRAALERALPSMRAWVDYAARSAAAGRHPGREAERPLEQPHERYLWDTGFHFGEWLEPDTPPAPDPTVDHGIVATAFLHRSAHTLALAEAAAGRPADAERYSRLAANVRAAWCAEYLAADNTLSEESQGHYVRALAFGLVPEGRRQPVADRLAALIRENGTRLGTGFLATGLLLPTLADAGHLDLAYELLFARDIPSWLGMIDRGATTMWEWWDGVTPSGVRGSLNHYSKGAVASFLYTHVAGIRLAESPEPGAEAYGAVVIAPQPGGGLSAAAASVHTRRGTVGADWRIEGGAFRLTATIPAGVTAEIRLPDGSRVSGVGGGTHSYSVAAAGL
ncbi:alpha-L-rhamnosidase [Microterricola pindariensis]|uniref:alpha-L-rhamnosidase n=1 Tax=Microterricola pindariensis TaxID=478010 RepID=A0ABX5AW82_9MICO|nr:alpha-L-rhamnosidase [Microterricola pindariensis]PPL19186.1 alpha-L-rhamnosidase [Microterricola pindariensis]